MLFELIQTDYLKFDVLDESSSNTSWNVGFVLCSCKSKHQIINVCQGVISKQHVFERCASHGLM